MDFGGHIRLTVAGSPMTIRGKFSIKDSDYNMSVVTNEDGSISQIGKPEAGNLTVDFEDSNPADGTPIVDWNAFMKSFPQNCAISEDDTGVLHTLTNAKASGKPDRNRLDGVVTGITLHWPSGGYTNTANGG